MRIKLFLLVDDFSELRMWHARDRLYYNRFVHSARNHFAGAGLSRAAGHGRRQRRRLSNRSLILFGHKIYFLVSVARSESTVSIRATSGPKVRVDPCLSPCAFLAGGRSPIYRERCGSTVCLCASCCG